MLNTVLATAIGASTGTAALHLSGEIYLPDNKVVGTQASGNVFAIDPYIYCEPNRHFIPLTEAEATVMRNALLRTAEVLDGGYLAE